MEEKNNGIKIAEHFRVEQSYDEYEKNIEEAHKNEIDLGYIHGRDKNSWNKYDV